MGYLDQAWAALKGGGFFGALVPTANQVIERCITCPQHGFGYLEVEEIAAAPVQGRGRPLPADGSHGGAHRLLDLCTPHRAAERFPWTKTAKRQVEMNGEDTRFGLRRVR